MKLKKGWKRFWVIWAIMASAVTLALWIGPVVVPVFFGAVVISIFAWMVNDVWGDDL